MAETQGAELETGLRDGLTEIRAVANGANGRMIDRPPVAGHAGLEDKQLKAQLAMLEHMTDAVLTASSDTCELEHLGNDVRALAEQLAAHDAALARLSRRDERPRDRVPNEPAAPKSTRHGSSS